MVTDFLGVSLVIGRVSHADGVSQTKENNAYRVFGTAVTLDIVSTASDRLITSLRSPCWHLTSRCSGRHRSTAHPPYNAAAGTATTDSSGYRETLTRLFLRGIAAHLFAHSNESLPRSVALLLQSPLAHKDWPLSFYSRERFFSVAAGNEWIEPDLTQNDNTRNTKPCAPANCSARHALQSLKLGLASRSQCRKCLTDAS
jgi:hypothetical protein